MALPSERTVEMLRRCAGGHIAVRCEDDDGVPSFWYAYDSSEALTDGPGRWVVPESPGLWRDEGTAQTYVVPAM